MSSKNINCYAFWNRTSLGDYRTGTLLVGRGCETVVGNCVMKNPGSAAPINLSKRKTDGRCVFTVDATMYAVAELFQIDKYGGAVRIYNLADLREADFSKTKGKLRLSDDIDDIDDTLPTYLGFGNMWRDPMFAERAAMFFDIAKKTTDVFNVDFCDNAFLHPLYLMRYAKNRPECRCLVDDFRKCIKYDMVKPKTLFEI